jgi:hypothetical protein
MPKCSRPGLFSAPVLAEASCSQWNWLLRRERSGIFERRLDSEHCKLYPRPGREEGDARGGQQGGNAFQRCLGGWPLSLSSYEQRCLSRLGPL